MITSIILQHTFVFRTTATRYLAMYKTLKRKIVVLILIIITVLLNTALVSPSEFLISMIPLLQFPYGFRLAENSGEKNPSVFCLPEKSGIRYTRVFRLPEKSGEENPHVFRLPEKSGEENPSVFCLPE